MNNLSVKSLFKERVVVPVENRVYDGDARQLLLQSQGVIPHTVLALPKSAFSIGRFVAFMKLNCIETWTKRRKLFFYSKIKSYF
jgi:hypothetical protein